MCGNTLCCGNTTEIKALYCHNMTALFCDNITALLCRKIRNITKIIQIYITERKANKLAFLLAERSNKDDRRSEMELTTRCTREQKL